MKAITRLRLCTAAVLMLAAAWMTLPQSTAQADIGWPPLNPGGSSLEAPEDADTNVRMVSEEVNLTVEPFELPVPVRLHGEEVRDGKFNAKKAAQAIADLGVNPDGIDPALA